MKPSVVILPVAGMTCASCVSAVEKAVKSLDGVKEANANLALGNVSIVFDPEKVSQESFVQKIIEAGYQSPGMTGEFSTNKSSQRANEIGDRQLLWVYILATPVALLGMFYHSYSPGHYLSFILTALLIVFPARVLFVRAWSQLRHRAPAMDLLVALSTLTAFFYSGITLWLPPSGTYHLWFETPAMLLAFVLTGRFLEAKARHRSVEAVNSLKHLQPELITVIRNGEHISLPATQVAMHDRVLIKPFEIIPVDGTILKGETEIDDSTITGEPLPKHKKKGDFVFAGTRNLEGGLTVLVTRPVGQTLLDGIIHSVARSLAEKAPSQQMADKIAGIFVPVVLIIALFTMTIWLTASGNISQALTYTITVLIIACPCALGLATPTALVAAAGNAARHGFLFRDGETMEKAGKIDIAAFDKTGTLTTGKLEIKDSLGIENLGIEDASVFYSMEKSSQHPLSKPVADALIQVKACNLSEDVQHAVRVIPGRGLSYTSSENTEYRIVSFDFIRQESSLEINEELISFATRHASNGRTLIAGVKDKEILWVMAAGDTLREDAFQAISQLHVMGIQTLLLTGDNHEAATALAHKVGIKEVHARLLPSDKKDIIQSLKSQGNRVLMAGDGINDAEALSSADVSVAMAKGSNLALDIASITLIGEQLSSIPFAIKLSRFTHSIIRQNLFWAFFYNVICIPLAAGMFFPFTGFTLNPMIAGAAMSLSSVIVVTNSLRISRLKFNP
ncbi:MAG: P-type Cu2+ transporter [Bacteroidales bacterium]|jgi:Cu2+-exporting ATPase|nr:P-type Cu2+ transporter [Bacteroidales bacterium]MDN5330133.1 P-type Cu2+ transporter [Bacteroidales bacterium]